MASELELWGGIECTVNRVRDTYFDQLERTQHASRIDDLDRAAALGIRALRYPVLWERSARANLDEFDFTWPDARLRRLRDLGVKPIVGLVHHGSGPRETNLLEASFSSGLQRYARAVAERYPWVKDFTPVNEPLTTARFSGLYGHWYPHRRDAASFLRALYNQILATQRAMQAIRQVIPDARLVQTEDFGKVFSAPKLKYQAAFENHRQWLSLDMLFGRVNRYHPLYGYLVSHGVREGELRKLECEPCPPDLIGINYYVTSDRYLDDRLHRYSSERYGSNGRDRYVDTEAVRTRQEGIVGHRAVIDSAWARYRTPVALTEVHLGCTEDEQARWLLEAWRAASAAKAGGADVRAITLWSMFGAYDWNSLVTVANGHYEPGAFDIRAASPRSTVLADVARCLSSSPEACHPLESAPGWWRRPERLLHPVLPVPQEEMDAASGEE